MSALPDHVLKGMAQAVSDSPTLAAKIEADKYFGKGGLLAQTLYSDVAARVTVRPGPGGGLYVYRDGYWQPEGGLAVRREAVSLLRERYRPTHAQVIMDHFAVAEPLGDAIDAGFINVPNGLLAWETGRLIEHTPDVTTYNQIPIPWQPDAECPRVDAWAREVFPDDATDFAYEVVGYALLNDQPLHKAILLYGKGRNGKGTFLRLLRALLGDANVSAVTPQSLDDNRFRAAQLHGKLANLVGDVDPKIFKATETFKQVTGGDLITAEHKHEKPFQFTSRALMVAAFNSRPQSADTTEGFFSRWLVVPFTRTFDASTADPSLDAKLTVESELRGLLVRAVAGLQRLMERGHFEVPASVQAATAEFRRVADPVRAFIMDECKPGGRTPRTHVYERYRQWCEHSGHRPKAARSFYEDVQASAAEMLGSGVRTDAQDSKGVRHVDGLSLIPATETESWLI